MPPYQERMKRASHKQMTNNSEKSNDYWLDEVAFLEARLNGSHGDIDSEDRSACEEALKRAKEKTSSQ